MVSDAAAAPPLNVSVDSTRTSAESLQSTSISVCSESSLLVPGKLFNDIANLKTCYKGILLEIQSNLQRNAAAAVSDGEILLLTREQLTSGCKHGSMKADALRRNLVDILDFVRPVCIPNYQHDSRPKCSPEC